MHVERYGHGGSPVVLLHGFATSSFVWRQVAPLIAQANHTAFAIDLFGHGESDRPFDADFGIAAQAEYLDRALTALRIGRASALVGLDLGAAVALRFAALRPERLMRLVLVNPIALDEVPAGDVAALQRGAARYALRVSRSVLGAAPIFTELLRESVADPDHMPDRLVARYLAPYVGRDGVAHLLALARSIRESELDEVALGELKVPTLVIFGEADRWVEERLPERLINAIPDSRLSRLPNVGRLVPEDAPEKLSELILAFLRDAGTV